MTSTEAAGTTGAEIPAPMAAARAPDFAPPQSLVTIVRRSFLFARLNADLEKRLVLIRAPAGCGKSELLALVWRSLHRRAQRAGWITLGADWGRAEIAAAIAGALGVAPGALEETLAAATEEAPVTLLFDRAERLGARSEAIEWVLEHLSPGLRIAIAGRRLPPLRLSRLRMRGLLAEFGQADLAFDRGEMQQVLGQWLRPDEIDRAIDTLAGWPALVQLAAQVFERDARASSRELVLEGTHPVLRDFVCEEVLPTLTPAEIHTLRACRDLLDFSLDIALDLAGRAAGPETLALVEDLPPLILADAQRSGWFRRHPVVAAAMDATIDEPAGARTGRLRRASELFAEKRCLEQAVLYASVAGDYELAVRTIEEAGGANLFLRAGFMVLQGILRAVPDDVVRTTPSLRLCRAVLMAKSGQIREARAEIDALTGERAAGRLPEDPRLDATLVHLSALIAIYEDEALDRAGIAALERMLAETPPEETWRRGWIHNTLVIAHTRADALGAAQAHADHAMLCYREVQSAYPQIFIQIHMGFVSLRANRITAALDHCRQAEKLIRSRQWADANLMAIAQVPRAAIAWAQGDLQEARQMLERAMPVLARGEGWVDFYAQGYATLARARFALAGRGEALVAAREALAEGTALAEARALPRLARLLALVDVELLTQAGQFETALAALRRLPDVADPAAWTTPREWCEAQLALARIELRSGTPERAKARLAAMEAAGPDCPAPPEAALRGALLRLEIAGTQEDRDGALDWLARAAQLAQPGEQVQQVRDETGLANLIRALVRRAGMSRLSPVTAEFVARIARGPATPGGILSARETEILRLLDAGMSNKAIARQLDVTESTVKFHMKNLFSKLGVSRRTLALSVARANGLLTAAE